jgi:hypothetical protein
MAFYEDIMSTSPSILCIQATVVETKFRKEIFTPSVFYDFVQSSMVFVETYLILLFLCKYCREPTLEDCGEGEAKPFKTER